ncbi:SDR family NAD(P)-dependent oxidoreductase, partial [Methylobacterium sp. WL122]
MSRGAPPAKRTCLVTGATSGIGYETALGLAKAGARVGIVGRDPGKVAADDPDPG